MIGSQVFRAGEKVFLVWVILFLVVVSGVQASPVVSSFKINNGAAETANPAVTLPSICEGATGATHSYMASESPDFTGAAWKPYASVPLFILSNTTSGTKTVYFKVKDSANAESAVTSDTITLGGEGYSVVAWGSNENGLCSIPSRNIGFVAIAPSMGLKSDGSIIAWGNSAELPEPNRDYVDIAASNGGWHFLGLKSGGSIVSWGSDLYGQCSVPAPNSGFVSIAAGENHCLGLKSNGSVVAWGENL
ncbi:MAG TPA: hypothetical protein PKH31_08620, partial [Candidatus Sumerlaeota bacterium]|nr:hypothetical protein [Candidatus Sumerlaeota bacterium]